MISWTNLLTRATVPAACFLLFLVLGKSENEYSRNWTGQKPKSLFYRGTTGARIRDREGLEPGHTTWPRDLAWSMPGGGLAAPRHPLGLSFRLYIALGTKTLRTRSKIHERVCSRCHLHPKIGRDLKLFPAPCRRGEFTLEAFFITMQASSVMRE